MKLHKRQFYTGKKGIPKLLKVEKGIPFTDLVRK